MSDDRPRRQSIKSTYDSRETGPRYHVTYKLNGRVVTWQQKIDDPFVRAVLRVHWLDRLKSLLRRDMQLEVLVGADPEMVDDVLELDGNCLVLRPSTRRDEFNSSLGKAMVRSVKEQEAAEGECNE